MFIRRSTLDPLQKSRKNKQIEYFNILEKCLQIPSDDKLILRTMIKNQHEQVIQIIIKYKKHKNLSQLQIALRKYLHKYKTQDKNIYKKKTSPEKQMYFSKQKNTIRRCSEQFVSQSKKNVLPQTFSSQLPSQIKKNKFLVKPNIHIEDNNQINSKKNELLTQEKLQLKIQKEIDKEINSQLNNLNDISISMKDITIREQDKSMIVDTYRSKNHSRKQSAIQLEKFIKEQSQLGNNAQYVPMFGGKQSNLSSIAHYFQPKDEIKTQSYPLSIQFNQLNQTYNSDQNLQFSYSSKLKKQLKYDFDGQNQKKKKKSLNSYSDLTSLKRKDKISYSNLSTQHKCNELESMLYSQERKPLFQKSANCSRLHDYHPKKLSIHQNLSNMFVTLGQQPIPMISHRFELNSSRQKLQNLLTNEYKPSKTKICSIPKDLNESKYKDDQKQINPIIKHSVFKRDVDEENKHKFGDFYKRIKLAIDGTLY